MQPRLTGIGSSRKRQNGIAAALAVAGGLMAGAAAPAPEPIGTWRLSCPEAAPAQGCTLRHKDASLQFAGYGVALEVQSIGGALVPVVIVRGVGAQKGIGSVLGVAVWLRLDQGAWVELPCNAALHCLPGAEALPALAGAFPSASLIRLRLDVTLPGGSGLPQPEHEYDLASTKRALERLKAAGPVTVTAPAAPGLDWKAMMQKLMKAGG
ncbi:MAG: hypothetical protein JSS43_33615 [Proteobacteria bacterium]|nr:hypothetical protein [Pseudomonadota bacterium]